MGVVRFFLLFFKITHVQPHYSKGLSESFPMMRLNGLTFWKITCIVSTCSVTTLPLVLFFKEENIFVSLRKLEMMLSSINLESHDAQESHIEVSSDRLSVNIADRCMVYRRCEGQSRGIL